MIAAVVLRVGETAVHLTGWGFILFALIAGAASAKVYKS